MVFLEFNALIWCNFTGSFNETFKTNITIANVSWVDVMQIRDRLNNYSTTYFVPYCKFKPPREGMNKNLLIKTEEYNEF